MDINKLYYFYVVAKHEHVTKASEELHIVQPALSKSIKTLENELGAPLFYKHKRNIKLTGFGKNLKARLDEVFPTIESIPFEIEKMKETNGKTINLNVLSASAIVTEAIVEYKKQHSDVIFQVIQNEEESVCDLSITTDSANPKLSYFSEFRSFDEEIFLAVPHSSKYSDTSSISLSQMKDKEFVNLAGTRLFRKICDSFCSLAGFTPKIIFESDSPITVINLIGANAGIGFWPEFSWGKSSQDIKLLRVNDVHCSRNIIVGLHKNASTSPVAKDFYEYLLQFITQLKNK